jgi:hypothetical protein
MPNLADIGPEHKSGNFGLGMRWNPGWLDGTAGIYYRKYDEKLPWSAVQMNAFGAVGLRMSYARDTELLGVSLGKNLGSVNTGFELSYRRNSALNSVQGFLAGSAGYSSADFFTYLASPEANIAASKTPAYSQVEGARGNTFHAMANMIYLLPKTALWETGNMQAELAYQRLDKVTKNPNLYYSVDYACKNGYMSPFMIAVGSRSAKDGCSTKDSLAFNLGFTPQWLEVLPSMTLAMPTSLSYGLMGNSPTLGGSSKGSYGYSLGLTATYRTLYEFGVAYADSHVDYGTAVNAANGVGSVYDQSRSPTAVQNSHGWLSFHFKTSF